MIDWLKPSTAIASYQVLSAKKFKRFHDCHIKHNVKRRHVLHELIEQYRSKKEHFDKELVLEAVRKTTALIRKLTPLFVNPFDVQIHNSCSS